MLYSSVCNFDHKKEKEKRRECSVIVLSLLNASVNKARHVNKRAEDRELGRFKSLYKTISGHFCCF